MILETAILMFVLLAVIFGFVLPLTVELERRHHPVLRERIGTSSEGIREDVSVWEFLRPFANAVRLLTVEGPTPAGPHPLLRGRAPGIAIVAAVVGLAPVPFGSGAYRFDAGFDGSFGETTISLVVADLDWGILAVLTALGFVQLADVVAAWAAGSVRGRVAALRASVRMLALAAATALSTLGLLLCFGTLGLGELAALQDTSFRVLGFLEATGSAEPLGPGLSWLQLPTWGVFLQPAGFALCLACAVVAITRPAPPLGDGPATEELRLGAFLTASFLERIVWAALITVLFLGGGAIPWISGEAIVAFVAQGYGEGFATGIAMLVHAGAFFAKLAAVVAGLTVLRARFQEAGQERGLEGCCRWILPLSLLNAAGTAVAILSWEGLVR